MSHLTKDQLAAMLEQKNRQDLAALWIEPVRQAMDEWEINTDARVAAFLAQVIHESASFNQLAENLNYTAIRLCKVWPKRFETIEAAQPFANNPERLANLVYASRMGNGDERSGDGYRYRGRGLIQLTGRENYTRCGLAIRQDLLATPDLLLQPAAASRSAAWFWKSHGLNELADPRPDGDAVTDFGRITKIINGGDHGLQARIVLWQRLQEILADV
ncbi:glycoside hydrolase family 19 protein [Rugamonas aquatica]|uniref:Glycoside hydrolase family 19 protein n=1 Tax=Rugamonas aquatica TaxID=2743357 RepID=A0A6A7N4M1_9BURK|nr:glycoside hydrolase family 19 protein [Rugamonas aquatica]MQA39966.1 glycoside hydrolase family 19 protein [Rugamonas aquatica]